MKMDELAHLTEQYGDATVIDVMIEEERKRISIEENQMMMYAEYSANGFERPPTKREYPDERTQGEDI
jgi:hypothetical protein